MLLDSIGKNVAILRTKQGFIELVFDLYQSEDQKLLKKTLTGAIPIGKALEAIAAKDSASEDIPRGDQTVFANDLEMTMEELPFSFNLGEINPSKDPLALELLLRCERYNHKLKIIKDRLQQMISDSDCLAVRPSSACPPPQQDIEHLNL